MSTLVFIYPQHIEFPETFEAQTIAIFNPYEFPIHFHFQCTRPTAFMLSATEGEILAKHSLDISINLLDKTIAEEKFQVRISLASNKGKKLGEKIIKVTLKSDKMSENEVRQRKSSSVDNFQELIQSGYESPKPIDYSKLKMDKVPNEYFVYAAFVICIIILFVPHEESSGSAFHMFQVSVNVKLVAAYILGIVTVFLIRN